jgi:hypothetical protein
MRASHAWEQSSNLQLKASIIKGSALPPEKGVGCSAAQPPLWECLVEAALGLCLEFEIKASNFNKYVGNFTSAILWLASTVELPDLDQASILLSKTPLSSPG